jgi:Zn-dependent protease with chaperone function
MDRIEKLQIFLDELCRKVNFVVPVKIIKRDESGLASVGIILMFYFITIGNDLSIFDDDEAKWIIGHEFGHICDKTINLNNYLDRMKLRINKYILCIYLFILSLCYILSDSMNNALFVMLLISFLVLFICIRISSRWKQQEYYADLFATQYTSKTIGLRALKKCKQLEANSIPMTLFTLIFGTHPTLNDRINRIKNLDE